MADQRENNKAGNQYMQLKSYLSLDNIGNGLNLTRKKSIGAYSSLAAYVCNFNHISKKGSDPTVPNNKRSLLSRVLAVNYTR